MNEMYIRKHLDHTSPCDVRAAWYFVTICAAIRGGTPFTDKADVILSAARHYQRIGRWFVALFLIMPDHIHMLVHVAPRQADEGERMERLPSSEASPLVGLAVPAGRKQMSSSVGLAVPAGRARRAALPDLARVIHAWKGYLTRMHNIRFQRGFFDTRIRDDAHYAEKWEYIVKNPVARGLVETPREWQQVIAYDRATGQERQHR